MKKSIWIIIVTYNPEIKQFQRLLNVLRKYNVLIVDNSENREFLGKIKEEKIINKQNFGFAKAVNQGLEYAQHRGAVWSVILNQDVFFTREDLDQFLNLLQSIKSGIVGPKCGRLDERRWTTMLKKTFDHKLDYVSASFVAIHKDVINKIGFFDERYFMYYEDVDYCVRAKQKGFELKQVVLKSFRHKESTSLGKNSVRHNYYLARNHLLFVEKLSPMSTKFYEFVRLPKSIYEYYVQKNHGGTLGLIDYFRRKFGEFK